MKIKGLLIGMLACTAMLVGCSDDDVLGNELENQQVKKADAYLTLSIASSVNSSRANNGNEGTTKGDGHQTPEHSGHENVGTADENQINSVLVLFYNTEEGADGFAHIYNLGAEATTSTAVKYNKVDVNLNVNDDNTLSPSTPFKLESEGLYNALIVLNPCAAIKNMVSNTIIGKENVKSIYDNILSGVYEGTNGSALGIISQSTDENVTKDNFMMANQKLITIDVDAATHGTPETAAVPLQDDGVIYVERVASKITFRPSVALTGAPKDFLNAANTYKYIAENMHTEYEITISDGWIWDDNDTEDTADDTYTYKKIFNKATTNQSAVADRKPIWVLIEASGTTYYEEKGEYTGIIVEDGENKSVTAKIMKPYTFTGTPIYQGVANESSSQDITYYVQLQKYALVNMNNKVYYTRHTSSDPKTDAAGVNWGTVSLTNYLYEPYSYSKSNATKATNPDANNVEVWANDEVDTDDWFGNTALKSVIGAIITGTNSPMKNLPGSIPAAEYEEGEDEVTGTVENDNGSGAVGENPEYSTIGTCLDYCLENVVSKDMQNKHLTAGIIFEAQIYDESGNVVPVMYQFNGSFYKDLKALNDATNGQFAIFLDENNTNGELDAQLKASGVITYRDGKCYYFSSQIKHYANQDDDATSAGWGVMEFAIMRNNIYSLAVTNVDGFGYASTNIETLTNSETFEDLSVYLTMEAKILPWIVRFNDIEF